MVTVVVEGRKELKTKTGREEEKITAELVGNKEQGDNGGREKEIGDLMVVNGGIGPEEKGEETNKENTRSYWMGEQCDNGGAIKKPDI